VAVEVDGAFGALADSIGDRPKGAPACRQERQRRTACWSCANRRSASRSATMATAAIGLPGRPRGGCCSTPGPEAWARCLLRTHDRSSGARPRDCCFLACCVSPGALAPEDRRQGSVGRSVRPGGAEVSADGAGVLVLIQGDNRAGVAVGSRSLRNARLSLTARVTRASSSTASTDRAQAFAPSGAGSGWCSIG
jgi:hypothetical protein